MSYPKSQSKVCRSGSCIEPVSPEVNVIGGKRKADEAETEDDEEEAERKKSRQRREDRVAAARAGEGSNVIIARIYL